MANRSNVERKIRFVFLPMDDKKEFAAKTLIGAVNLSLIQIVNELNKELCQFLCEISAMFKIVL